MFNPIPDDAPIQDSINYRTFLVIRGPYNFREQGARVIMGLGNRVPGVHVSKVAWYPFESLESLGLPLPPSVDVGRWRPWAYKIEWSRRRLGASAEAVDDRYGSSDPLFVVPAIAVVAGALTALLLAVGALMVVAHFPEEAVTRIGETFLSPGVLISAIIIVALFTLRPRVAIPGG